jgi:hypothetical protein
LDAAAVVGVVCYYYFCPMIENEFLNFVFPEGKKALFYHLRCCFQPKPSCVVAVEWGPPPSSRVVALVCPPLFEDATVSNYNN